MSALVTSRRSRLDACNLPTPRFVLTFFFFFPLGLKVSCGLFWAETIGYLRAQLFVSNSRRQTQQETAGRGTRGEDPHLRHLQHENPAHDRHSPECKGYSGHHAPDFDETLLFTFTGVVALSPAQDNLFIAYPATKGDGKVNIFDAGSLQVKKGKKKRRFARTNIFSSLECKLCSGSQERSDGYGVQL